MSKKQAILKNYKGASKHSTKRCSGCKWYLKQTDTDGECKQFDFICNGNYVCDNYLIGYKKESNLKVNEKMIREYQQIPQHSKINKSHPKEHTPSPTYEDYEAHYIQRYFVRWNTRTTNPILEVSEGTFQKTKDTWYHKLEMRWKIAGPEKTIYKDGAILDKGIAEANRDLIKLHNRTFPGIGNYLKDYTELAYKKVDKDNRPVLKLKKRRKSVYGSGLRAKPKNMP